MPIPSDDTRTKLDIRLYNAGGDDYIPFGILSQVLSEMQQAFYLLALQHEGREIAERARIPSDIEQRYVLGASVPKQGSYMVPAMIGDPLSGLFAPDAIHEVFDTFRKFSRALSTSSADVLRHIVPDSRLRRRILDRFRAMIPKAGSGWTLDLVYEQEERVTLDDRSRREISRLLKRADGEVVSYIVTGTLIKIHFAAHKLTLRHPVTQRELDCFYDTDIEELLLQHPRGLIQVIGTVVLDEDNQPKEIDDVEDIREVDLSVFRLSEFQYADRVLRFRHPIEMAPVLDESQQLFCLEYPALGIDIYAPTREELEPVLRDELDVLWRNYAQEDSARLTPAAQRLKERLLAAIEEVPHATRQAQG